MGLVKFVAPNLLKEKIKLICSRKFGKVPRKPPWRVLFFGTDEFSVFSLKALSEEYRKGKLINKLQVVTTVKGKPNPVKIFSEKEKLHLHRWPPDLLYGLFDVGLVVSFGHLIPEDVIEKFEFGMLNVHASLLPRWRGAAPIIYAIANGDTETGVTIMRISPKKFDIGEIVHQDSISIHPDTKMNELYAQLGVLGAENLVTTLKSLPDKLSKALPQPVNGVTYAPKVNPAFACIKWDTMPSQQIYNLERALFSFFNLQTTWKGTPVKLINVTKNALDTTDYREFQPGFVEYDKQLEVLNILCTDFKFITVEKVGVVGKRIMTAKDFNNGYIKKEIRSCRYFK